MSSPPTLYPIISHFYTYLYLCFPYLYLCSQTRTKSFPLATPPQVLSAAIDHLEAFLTLFARPDEPGILSDGEQMAGGQLVLKRLLKLEEATSLTCKYSLHCQLLRAFRLLPWLLATDALVDHVLPVLDRRVDSRALPVRHAAIRALLLILRKVHTHSKAM